MRTRSLALAAPVAVTALLLLAGCVPDPATVTPTITPTASAGPSASSTPTPTPSATAGNAIDGIPMTVTCDKLISAQAMYDYNPNFSLKSGYSPAVGSLAAQVVTQKGLACEWVNQTSGDLIDVSVAHLPDAHLTALKNELVTTSNSVPTYSVEGYFKLNGSIGEAQAFSDPYWIVATSKAFLEPGDAQPIVAAAIASLG
ncbi:MAG: iron ABC transporter ATP-binding protein [Rhodoglobus sp.]